MLSEADRKKAAQLLLTAERDRKSMVQLSSTWPSITFEDAYAIQNEVQQQKMAEGRKLIGHKVGLTSKAMQQSSQINEPDYGHLLDDMMIADGAKVPHANYCAPRVEVELAFILGKPLQGPGVGLTDVLRATEYVVPALENVDARVQNPRKIFDTISDNGAAAGIVVTHAMPISRTICQRTCFHRRRPPPTPTTEEATTCVVLPGAPIREAPRMTAVDEA